MLVYSGGTHGLRTVFQTEWRFASDRVMGGRSHGQLVHQTVDGSPALSLTGDVSLDNGGGFIQMNTDLSLSGVLDLSPWWGFRARVTGDGGPILFLVKTTDLDRPWQSYRASAVAKRHWIDQVVRFSQLDPYRTAVPFNPKNGRRFGIAVLGRQGPTSIALAEFELLGAQ